ncbi:TonB-dependent receptor [Aquimarina gracilis]|uniref:TonB-dependent receptor n=1 Tax=Aquimarina gracilis TaxID=874422 RepID=A0ABU5ZRJ5_9FLAO|nr:TonB-dependent receptor [Aquimarina gracilis]MEB3343876.1 TonB-dependent receptor [Aquimarina gracilis]
MKRKATITFFFLLFASLIFYGQESRVVRGTVIDPDANLPLFGATVVLLDSTGNTITGVITNEFGEFVIRTKTTGKATLQASYIGFSTRSFGVELDESEINVGSIILTTDAAELDQVVVIGNVEGKSKALNLQRTSDNIKNVVSADLIGRFPDLNVAEALQRVSGVNISRDKGEGSTVSIRGTPLNYTTIQINGEQIPSVQVDGSGGSRTESLDLIPADQLAFMEVTKVPTPDMDGDAIGGTVNLKTAVARRYDLGIKAESGFGYNDISSGLNSLNRLRIDKRFFKTDKVPQGKLGVIFGGSMFRSNNSEHRTDAVWDSVNVVQENADFFVIDEYQYRLTENERERFGATATVDYKFDGNNRITFNYVYSRRQDTDVRNRFRWESQFNSGGRYQTLDSITNGRVRRDINISDELKENNTFNLEGEHRLGDWDIDWKAFYTFSERTLNREVGNFQREDLIIIADNPLGVYGEEPNFRVSTTEEGLSAYDPFFYAETGRFENDFETVDANNLVGKLDFTKHFQFNQNSGIIKFGGKYRIQTNDKFREDITTVVNDPNNVINEEEFFLRSLSGIEPTNYLYGDYRFGPLIGTNQFRNVLSTNSRFFEESDQVAAEALRTSANNTYETEENIYSGYAMAKIQFEKLMILAGLRYEYNEVIYDAFDVTRSGNSVLLTPIQGGNEYNFWLPNVHLKYSFTDYTSLRLSGVMNYARPNFNDIVPFSDLNEDDRRLRLGNSDLQPAEAINVDLLFEHYFKDVGVISLGGFYKNIDQFQFQRITPVLPQDFPGFDGTAGYFFTQPQNGETATVLGIEFNFFRTLGFLPGFLKNFNIEGNYTYTYSDAFTQDRDNIKLPGQADHTFNAALAFDYKAFSARVSANYNGSFSTSLGSNEQQDNFQDDRLQIDANASLKIGKNLRFYIEGVNLSNEPTIRYEGDKSRLTRRAYFGWSTRAGVSYTL